MEFKSVSKVYELGEGRILGVDQSEISGDKTCLCFAKYDDEKTIIKDIKYIENQDDMDKYINRNMKEIYGVFK